MSTIDTPAASAGMSYEETRKAWGAAKLHPLWENKLAHKEREGGPTPQHWPWREVRPLVDHAMMVTSPAAIERRVLTFTDPEALGGPGSTCTNLTTALQILLPGEKARPHRHAMNALRFVIEGGGASTVVDGKDCLMEPGAALAKLGRLEEAKAAAAKVLELHPTFRFSRQFAGVNCAPALADPMSEALRMAGLPE